MGKLKLWTSLNVPGFHYKKRFISMFIWFIFDSLTGQPGRQLNICNKLKKLSLEELMNVEVTSVSKRPEKLKETASAIQ